MKRYHLLLWLLFGATISQSQNWMKLNDKAIEYSEAGDYKQAIDYAQKAMARAEKEFGRSDSNYATSMNTLAQLYEIIGEYIQAESLYKQALQIREKVLGKNNPSYASSLNNLGGIYYHMGNYPAVVTFFTAAMDLTKNIHSLSYATRLNNLAAVYELIGNYADAEPLFKKALEIRKNALGEEHPYYAQSLNNLAMLYQSMGNYTAAEPLFLESLEINRKNLGEDNPAYASCLNNLALLYETMGNFSAALTPYKQALEIRKKLLGEDHPDYAASLTNLASLYHLMGNYAAAEPLFNEALGVLKRIVGPEHPIYLTTLNNLAKLYESMGNNAAAEPLLNEVLETRKKVLGEGCQECATDLENLGGLYENMGRYSATEPLYLAALKILKDQERKQMSFLSEKEQEKYLEKLTSDFMLLQSYILRRYQMDSSLSTQLNNVALFAKGLQLTSGISMRQKILISSDSGLVNLFNQWTTIKQALAKLYSMPLDKRFTDVDALEEQANDLEKQLTRSSQAFKEQREKQNIETADVQAKLGKDEAAIEFTSFLYNNGEKWIDSLIYVALVIRPGASYPALIPLFEEDQLNSLVNDSTSVNALYSANRGLPLTNSTVSYGTDLYNLIWSKIEPELKGVRTVYYSPSGQLNRIAFAALPVGNAQLLSDKYNLVLLSSTADIVNKHEDNIALNSNSTIVLFGGIKYDASVAELQAASQNLTVDTNVLAMASNTGNSNVPLRRRDELSNEIDWPDLPGTLVEVNKINVDLKQRNINTTLYTGSIATEDVLRTLQGKNAPTVLHIATHGFFFPEKKDTNQAQTLQLNREELASKSENPLLRTGLIFAGGNNKWKNDTVHLPDGLSDGILTAYDVSNMDLSNTKLAVLSACQTGLGDIKGSEGVYGMQRAFKMAGVDYLIVSLWSVPDEATQEFMTHFYSRWAEGGNLQKAFEETQQMMRKKYKDPYDWAAFVLMK